MADRMRALTLWQPMAWAVAAGYKPLENRGWPPPDWITGERIAIHAGKRWDEGHHEGVCWLLNVDELDAEARIGGAIIGTVRIDGWTNNPTILTTEQLRWWSGPIGWLVSEAVQLATAVPCRGYQKLWRLPEDVDAQVRAQVDRG